MCKKNQQDDSLEQIRTALIEGEQSGYSRRTLDEIWQQAAQRHAEKQRKT